MAETLERYEAALAPLVVAVLESLGALERTQRDLDPPLLDELRRRLAPYLPPLSRALGAFRTAKAPDPLGGFHACWLRGAEQAEEALCRFLASGESPNPLLDVLASLTAVARAQESLYGVHEFPPLSRYFVEAPYHRNLPALDPPRPEGLSVGLHHSGGAEGAGARGQFCLYVPESYDRESPWPLVVALHGGSGSGREFLWAWLREARGRRFLLLAPTARGPTWPLIGPDLDGKALRAMVRWVCSRWRVEPRSILLTGLSDGATYALLTGLSEDSPFTALAPIAGVLHPANWQNGNLARAAGCRIYLVHGVRDWMFPVETARMARDRLRDAGADLEYREIEDLSHTYPREENGRILEWFDASLTVPAPGRAGSA